MENILNILIKKNKDIFKDLDDTRI